MSNVSVSSLASVYDQLTDFANLSNFWSLFNTAFGSSYDSVKAATFKYQWQTQDFSLFPQIEIVSNGVLGTANGAYTSSNNTIYLSEQFLATSSQQSLVAVILEEFGHFVDAQVNSVDSVGDEGAIFAALVAGEGLDVGILQALRAEDDHGTIMVNGEVIEVEKQDFTGTIGNDNITGTSGGDNISGLDGNDTLNGLEGNDYLNGGNGNDSLNGGANDDILTGGTGADSYIGGSGYDIANLQHSTVTSNITVSYINTTGGTGFEGDTIKEVEVINIDTGSGSDVINISATTGTNFVRSGGGNDTVTSGSGSDIIFGEDGDDILKGGFGNDGEFSNFTDANGQNYYAIYGGLYGGAGNDQLFGEDGNDRLFGEDGNDSLDGGANDDILTDGTGADAYIGGSGYDIANFQFSTVTSNITVSYINTTSGTGFEGDTIKEVEAINIDTRSGTDVINISATIGTNFVRSGGGNDTVTSGSGSDIIFGEDGDDILKGGFGNDGEFSNFTDANGQNYYAIYGGLYGGAGNDQLFGEDGNDRLFGEDGNDSLDGGANDDILTGGTGADSYIGGSGYDIANLQHSTVTSNITVSYINTTGGTGFEGDTIKEVEVINIDTGSGSDVINISATTGTNFVRSGGGNDTVTSGSGSDIIFGEDGDDILLLGRQDS